MGNFQIILRNTSNRKLQKLYKLIKFSLIYRFIKTLVHSTFESFLLVNTIRYARDSHNDALWDKVVVQHFSDDVSCLETIQVRHHTIHENELEITKFKVVIHQVFVNKLDGIRTRLGYNAEFIDVDAALDAKYNQKSFDIEILIVNNKYFLIFNDCSSLVNNRHL